MTAPRLRSDDLDKAWEPMQSSRLPSARPSGRPIS